jgi:hypothetical protein
MKLSDIHDKLLHEEIITLLEMPNLTSDLTGLKNIIVWVSVGGKTSKHGPRIKVCKGSSFKPELSSTIPLTGKPRIIGDADISLSEFSDIINWIGINRSTIVNFWNETITSDVMQSSIKKLK